MLCDPVDIVPTRFHCQHLLALRVKDLTYIANVPLTSASSWANWAETACRPIARGKIKNRWRPESSSTAKRPDYPMGRSDSAEVKHRMIAARRVVWRPPFKSFAGSNRIIAVGSSLSRR